MNEKYLLSRIAQKHDIEANWNNAADFVPMRGELIVYDIDANYDYERLKIGDGTTTVVDLPFVDENVSWNTLKDRPFGEEIEVINEHLNITWDGNTEGLVNVSMQGFVTLYKVSDITIRKEDMGYLNARCSDGREFEIGSSLTYGDGVAYWVIINPSTVRAVFFVERDNAVSGDIVFPKAGVYFGLDPLGGTVTEVYSVEPVEQTRIIVKHIETKYLPKHLHFGKVKTGGDTLTWDGNTEGLAVVNGILYKVSDSVPTSDDFANGCSMQVSVEGAIQDIHFSAEEVVFEDDGSCMIGTSEVLIIPRDNYESEGITIPEKGVYFFKPVPVVYACSFTIPGYTGFPSIKKIEEKYLPEMTEEDAMELLAELSIVEPITNENGEVLTDETGAILSI